MSEEIQILSTADCWIDSCRPTQNMHGEKLNVVRAQGCLYRSILKFGITSLVGAEINKVEFIWHSYDDDKTTTTTPRQIGLHLMNSSDWTESTVTHDIVEALGYDPTATVIVVEGEYGWYTYDITDLVKSLLAGGITEFSILMAAGPDAGSWNWDETKKHETRHYGNAPYLAVNRVPVPECGDYTTQAECEAAGCYWWSDNVCRGMPEPEPVKGLVILRFQRYETIPKPPDTEAWVDNYVAENSYANAICLADVDPLGVISYTGYSPDKYWVYKYDSAGKASAFRTRYDTLKATIDRFHEHGWKVFLESTNRAWQSDETFFGYITYHHPELAFINAEGERKGIDSDPSRMLIDWFAKFATDDPELGISAGERLIDVYCARLSQMITDGSFVWDGWFGTDGWNGFSIWYYGWYTSNPDRLVSFSDTEIADFEADTGITVPAGTTVERATWILNNALGEWWAYWNNQWAKLYARIRDAIKTVNPGAVGTIIQGDTACVWYHPNWPAHAPAGCWDIREFEGENAFDFYHPLDEHTRDGWTRGEALVVGLLKSKRVTARLAVGLYPNAMPVITGKKVYLADSISHVWFDKVRYRACDWNLIFAQHRYSGSWDNVAAQELFAWISQMRKVLDQPLTPIWLGPTYTLPDTECTSDVMKNPLVYSQWIDNRNLTANVPWKPSDGDPYSENQPCPVVTGTPDIDIKVFQAAGKIIIPMMNMQGGGAGTVTVVLDLTALAAKMGLADPVNYKIYLQSDPNALYQPEAWVPLTVTLNDGADILVIEYAGAHSLTIASAGNGTTDPPPGTYLFTEGQVITVAAQADDGYYFDHWDLDGATITEPIISFVSDAQISGKTLTAYFAELPPDKWEILITSTEGGTTNPVGENLVSQGQDIIVEAFPAEGFILHHWEFDGQNIGVENPINIAAQPVGTSHTLIAVFSTPGVQLGVIAPAAIVLFALGSAYYASRG